MTYVDTWRNPKELQYRTKTMKETVSDRERSSESVIVENRYQYLWWKITLELQAERCVIDNTGEKNPKESRLSRCPPLYGACMKPRVEYTTNRWLRRAILVLFGRGFFYYIGKFVLYNKNAPRGCAHFCRCVLSQERRKSGARVLQAKLFSIYRKVRLLYAVAFIR